MYLRYEHETQRRSGGSSQQTLYTCQEQAVAMVVCLKDHLPLNCKAED